LPSHDTNGRRIDHSHPFDMFWAKDQLGHYLFVLESSEALHDGRHVVLPDLVGIKARYLYATSRAEKHLFVLLLNDQQNWELFYTLCVDLVGSTRQAATAKFAFQIILRRLARWHDFLKANRNGLLSEEKIKGIIGELFFLKEHLIPAFGAGTSVNFWQGPEGAPQDFCTGECVIEVKCQSGGTRPFVRISSEFQLCSALPELYLFVVTLNKAPSELSSSINLPGLVAEIRNELNSAAFEQIERFSDLLYGIGYTDSDNYLNYSYLVVNEAIYKVTPEFPRICHEELPSGISGVTYDLNLGACEGFLERPTWMEAIV